MYVSARERKILEHLLLKKDGTVVKDIAEELGVSPRTVHRDLKGVEEILKDYNLALNKKSGAGIQVVGSDEMKQKLHMFLFNLYHNDYTPEERQTIIFATLLEAVEPLKLMTLAGDLNVTIATISNDLNRVEERIKPFGLQLIRKRGYGVEIEGSEMSKRRAMSSLISENLDEFGFISIIKENIQKKSTTNINTITDRLLGLVDKRKVFLIEKLVDEVKEDLPYSIADSSYVGLVVHLALAIERIQQGENILFNDDYLESIKETKEQHVAQTLVKRLEDTFQLSISEGEVGYITMHLLGAKLRHDQGDFLDDMSIGIVAQQLINYVGKQVNENLGENLSLFQGLVTHLRPAIYRLKQNMGISNPLLDRIQQDYEDLFTIVKKGIHECLPDLHVPDTEIGYIVMHFASALIKGETVFRGNVLVVCSSGIGTSKVLATKLQNEFPNLSTITNKSMFEIDQQSLENYDLIVSTIPLESVHDYVLVSPFLSKEDIEKIKAKIQEKQNKDNRSISTVTQEKNMDRNEHIQKLNRMKVYNDTTLTLLQSFQLSTIQGHTLREVLSNACSSLQIAGMVTDSKHVVEDLIKREQIGGLGIPDTSLSLYHTRSSSVAAPSFTVYQLQNPLEIEGMDDRKVQMERLLLLVAPEHIQEEGLEVLSQVSASIIRDDKTIHQFEQGNEQQLFSYLAEELSLFIKEKMNE
ncbi:BglG family transcription antiterminator [Salirhabdus salicampi]|uniref:BglG family transcription antiterminator n=1 Tax=Salirhabdus salicampi TaxID=476102 RepID=UPI0020C25C08|nr:BglG family transcription antiterminator [Salirhabdus salicampi]MCP8617432.1 BglG family transcription antiterminator [Salirhabdus salicampi]